MPVLAEGSAAKSPADPASWLALLSSLLRPHILLIAGLAAAAFGWLFDGQANWVAAGWVAFDWLLLNFWNRLADVEEDRHNHVPGTALAAAHARPLFVAAALVWAASFTASLPLGPGFNGLRLAFQAGGFLYNYRLLPGSRRFKDLLGWKNLSAGALFVLSDLGYPLLSRHGPRPVTAAELAWLIAFFLPLELSYEVLYDLRDLSGDRLAGLRTLPVVLGEASTRRLVAASIGCSALALVAGLALRALSFEEGLLIAAPIQQALVLRLWFQTRITARGAVGVTYLGAAQLASFLLWTGLGLPLRPTGWSW